MSLLALASAAGAAGPITGPDARRAAQAELRKVQYHRDDPGFIARIFDWIGDRLDSVVNGTPSGSATLLFAALLVVIVVVIVVRAGRPRRLARAAAADPLAPDATVDHRRLAVEFEAQGRLAEALREWVRASVQTIEERGILDPRPGRTGAGVAREAGAVMPAIRADLNAVVDCFDAVWFGRRTATGADVAAARAVADAVRSTRFDLAGSATAGPGYAVPQ